MSQSNNHNTIAVMRILTGLSLDYAEQAERITRFVAQLAELTDDQLADCEENTLELLQNFNIVTNQSAATQQAMRRFATARQGI